MDKKKETAQQARRARWPYWVATIVLAYLVCTVFFPIVGFEFIDLDMKDLVIENPYVREFSVKNIKHIFTTRNVVSYYPVRLFTYLVDYQIWGLNAGGFKFTNGLIHLVNVYLIFWLILRLFRRSAEIEEPGSKWREVLVATLGAGVFGVHPVVVEPVTWVHCREELLMTLGALGCIHFHMTARRLAEDGANPQAALAFRVCAILSCVLACLSNAVASVIPLLITTWDVLTLDRPKFWRIIRGTSVLWVIGVATIVIKTRIPAGDLVVGPVGDRLEAFSPDRLMVIANVYWLNVKTLLWPTELRLSYEWCRPGGFLDLQVILGMAAIGLSCAVAWIVRRRSLLLFGLLWFAFVLGPSSQIMPHGIPRADRLLYLPLVGLAIALAMYLRPLAITVKRREAVVGAGAAAVLALFLLINLSARHVQTWRNDLTVWSNSVRLGPNNIFAQRNFAIGLAKIRGFDQAVAHYQSEIARDTDNAIALDSAAWLLGTYQDVELRDYATACRLTERACELSRWEDTRLLKGFAIVFCNAAADLVQRGEFRGAIECYERVLEIFPEDKIAVFNLAWLLATCPDEKLRDPARAVDLAETTWQERGVREALRLKVLAAAYAGVGRFDEAVAAVENAIQHAEAVNEIPLANELRNQLEIYHHGVANDGRASGLK